MNYPLLMSQAEALLSVETDALANAANLSAFIFEHMPDINWAGFYFRQQDTLILGPFQGKVACTRIPMGEGVCGAAAAQQQTLRIDDVHQFDGHIACDSASNSEVVVPLIRSGEVVGVLDIDSPSHARFNQQDQEWLEGLASVWLVASHAE